MTDDSGKPVDPNADDGGGTRISSGGPQFQNRTYEITVYNFKRDRDVVVLVELTLPAKQELEPRWRRPSADRAETDLTVKRSDNA